MSSPDAKPNLDPAEVDRIAAELAALGEDPLADDPNEDEALAFALAPFADRAPDVDIATVQTLAGWADPEACPQRELSELAQARVWRTVELRTKQGETPDEVAAPTPSKRPLVLGAVVALFAAAAAVVLVPVLTPSDSPEGEPATVARAPQAPTVTAEELDVLSTQARASLAALDRLSGEPRGSARAAAMADAYARRLEAEG